MPTSDFGRTFSFFQAYPPNLKPSHHHRSVAEFPSSEEGAASIFSSKESGGLVKCPDSSSKEDKGPVTRKGQHTRSYSGPGGTER